jgi:TolB-like protein/Tfp pilus assembly protein PilF
MTEFLVRLRQRKLVQWSLAYVAFALALLQGMDMVAQRFGWPDGLMRGVFIAAAVGLPVVLVLAWYHGERGMQRVGGVELLILALLFAIGGGALWQFARGSNTAPVAVAAADTVRASAVIPASAASIPEKSIAVLPLANESGNKDQQYFSDGLSEDLINALSQFDGLKVISRNSSFQFRNSKDDSATIGRKLGVAHLLEGSVRRQGDEVRITAQLVNAVDGSTLWSQQYDRPYKDLFALQDDITQAVATALKAKLMMQGGAVLQSDRPPSGNLAAYEAFQKGKFNNGFGTQTGHRHAIANYEEAIRMDPGYAAAYARLSSTWTELGAVFLVGRASRQAYAKAQTTLDTALRLQPQLASAYRARGYLLLSRDLDWIGAETAYRRALQLEPGSGENRFSYALALATLGRLDRAITMTRQTLVTDPQHASRYVWLAAFLQAHGNLDEAARMVHIGITYQPTAASFRTTQVSIAIQQGDSKAALKGAQLEQPGTWQTIALALALQIGNDRAAADAALKRLIDGYGDGAAFQIAEVYAVRRDPDNMFKWLDRAWAQSDSGISGLLYDPMLLRYQRDPRFAVYCRKVGLPAPTASESPGTANSSSPDS